MEQRLLTEKNMQKASKVLETFQQLSPEEMLQVIFFSIQKEGSINNQIMSFWEKYDKRNTVSQEDRFDEILNLIQYNGKSNLDVLLNSGVLEFCMPLCFPIKKGISKRDIKDLSQNYEKCRGDIIDKLTAFLFPFELPKVRETMEQSNFDEEAIELIVKALSEIENFTLIKSPEQLKRFIYKNGMEFYYFEDILARNLHVLLDIPEYKRLSKKYLLEDIQSKKEPIFKKDLNIEIDDLKTIGLEGEEADDMMDMLIEYIHLHPEENTRVHLINRANAFKKSKLKRFFRKTKWAK